MLPSITLKGCWWFPICTVCVIWLWIILKMFSLTVGICHQDHTTFPNMFLIDSWALAQCILMHTCSRKRNKKPTVPFLKKTMFRAHYSTNNNNNSFQSSRSFYGMLINPFEVFINFSKLKSVIYQSKKWEMRIQSIQYFLHELNITLFLLLLIYFTPSST